MALITKKIEIRGKTIFYTYSYMDYSKSIVCRSRGLSDTKWVSEYNRYKKATLCDISAPQWFCEFSSLVDSIYFNESGFTKDVLDYLNDSERRAAVEYWVMKLIPNEQRAEYLKARKKYYDSMFQIGFVHPREDFQIAQELIEQHLMTSSA